MRKLMVSASCLIFAVALLVGPAGAATIRVPEDHSTIQAAVTAASNGDIIQVGPGVYTENVLVDKSVMIRGQEGAINTTVQASDKNTAVFAVVTSDVIISGFTVKGADGHLNATGVLVGGRFPGDTLYVGTAFDVTISKCIVENNGQGIYVWGADNTTIVNNTVRYNGSHPGNVDAGNGIIAWAETGPAAQSTSMVNNEVYGNDKFGIFVGASSNTDFAGTKINGNNLYQNGAYTWLGYTYPPGANWLGMGFMNALGSIKVSGNKILATASSLDIWVSYAPGLRAVGNPIRDALGPNIPMPTP